VWSYDPVFATQSGSALPTGTVVLVRMNLPPAPALTGAVTVDLYVGTAATGANYDIYVGLYASDGTNKATSADLSAWGTSTGKKSVNLTISGGGTPINGGPDSFFWVAVLGVNGGHAPPGLARATGLAALHNANLSAAETRFGQYGSSLTSLPGSITPASITQYNQATWAALL
jgi:hypothetical protein